MHKRHSHTDDIVSVFAKQKDVMGKPGTVVLLDCFHACDAAIGLQMVQNY